MVRYAAIVAQIPGGLDALEAMVAGPDAPDPGDAWTGDAWEAGP
jgi:hypothetical protein